MYKIKIESMNCMSCVHNIEDALKESDQSTILKADFKTKILSVEAKLSNDDIKKLIIEAGYPVTDLMQNPTAL